MNLSSGCIVEFIAKGSIPEAAVVLNTSGSNVRLMLTNGKETNVSEKKILLSSNRSLTGVSDKEACKQNLIRFNNARKEIAEKINLAEIHELLVEDQRFYELDEIAGFLYDPSDYDSSAALLRKLCEDHIYFKSKNNAYQPVSEEALKQALELQQKKEQQEKEEGVLVEALKDLLNNGRLDDCLTEYIQDIKDFVAKGEEAGIAKKLSNAFDKAGINSNRKVFQALVNAGILDQDENIDIIKYRVPVEFGKEQLKEAEELLKTDFKALPRTDLTALKTWAIDSPGSKDRDDAFSFEKTDDGYTLWVHISDPSELIKEGSILDKEAARRGSSIYMPDLRVHMFPDILSENFLSLDEGKERLSLTFVLKFNSVAEFLSVDIVEALIKVEKATDYDTANSLLAEDNWLNEAYQFSEKLKASRASSGAVILPRQPELSVKVVDGEIIVEHENRDELTAGMIAEFMIWANHAAAEWFHKNAIPCLYRMQDGDSSALPEIGDSFEPVAFWNTLKQMHKTVVGPNFGRHFSLGIDGYTQISSPIRRYSDLVLHRQIKSFLNGRTTASQNDIEQIIMISDTAVSRADEVMRNRERYFLLKYLKQQQKNKEVIFDGVVVETGLTEVNFYVDFFCAFRHCRKPNFDVGAGTKVKVKVNQIDLFDNIVRFDLRPA